MSFSLPSSRWTRSAYANASSVRVLGGEEASCMERVSVATGKRSHLAMLYNSFRNNLNKYTHVECSLSLVWDLSFKVSRFRHFGRIVYQMMYRNCGIHFYRGRMELGKWFRMAWKQAIAIQPNDVDDSHETKTMCQVIQSLFVVPMAYSFRIRCSLFLHHKMCLWMLLTLLNNLPKHNEERKMAVHTWLGTTSRGRRSIKISRNKSPSMSLQIELGFN